GPNLKPWVTEPAKLARYEGIVALKVDRLTRGNREETADLERWARDHGKGLLIASADVHFPSEGMDGAMWDFMLRQAHQEWLNTSERYTRMQRTKREDERLHGRAPYGYRIVKLDELGKTLVPDPTEAKVIQDAAGWYLDGETLDAICERLNAAQRLPRVMSDGRQPLWCAKTLSGVLRNETLVGRRTDASGRTLLKVPAILDRKTWQAVIDRMDARATRKGVSQAKSPALLTSIIRCGEHQRNMYRTGTGYYCRVKGCRAFITVSKADDFVHETMTADKRRDFVDVVTPGSAHDDEIAEVKRDMAEAVAAEDFDRFAALRTELDRLRSLPATPGKVERRRSGKTIAEMWGALPDDAARRAYLMERSARATYGDGWLVVTLGALDAA
ncbi:MAG: recombinase family protein, partial [bacterium]